jgi:hypothetical protein
MTTAYPYPDPDPNPDLDSDLGADPAPLPPRVLVTLLAQLADYDRIMGPNGQAQYWAPDVSAAVDPGLLEAPLTSGPGACRAT